MVWDKETQEGHFGKMTKTTIDSIELEISFFYYRLDLGGYYFMFVLFRWASAPFFKRKKNRERTVQAFMIKSTRPKAHIFGAINVS